MRKLRLLIGVWLSVGYLGAQAGELCQGLDDPNYFRVRALNSENRIAFKNPRDGVLNLPIGLCWWHSRLQRSLIYLARVRPLLASESPMSRREIQLALRKVISERSVVTLRGYDSIFEFTRKNKKDVHGMLKWWQGLEAGNVLSGLKGRPIVSAHKLEKLMRRLYDEVEKKRQIAYQMLQYPGLTAHAWLVQRVLPVYENMLWSGFDLYVIDSNYPLLTRKFTYRVGQTHFIGDFGPFTPYLQWRGSWTRYHHALRRFCNSKTTDFSSGDEKYNRRVRLEI